MNKRLLLGLIIVFLTAIIIFFFFFSLPSNYKNKITHNTHSINAFDTQETLAKVIVFSDLHLLYDYDVDNLKKVVEHINQENPDIVIFNGDLFDSKSYKKNNKTNSEIVNILKEIQPVYGKFAILGDQDQKVKETKNILVNSDFEILTNVVRNIKINNKSFNLIGLFNNKKYTNTLNKLNDKSFNFTVTHNPEIIDSIKNYKIDLIVTGHTLGGQYNLPLYGSIFNDIRSVPYYKGYNNVEDISVYNSNGLGIYQSSMRFLAPSSIEIFELY